MQATCSQPVAEVVVFSSDFGRAALEVGWSCPERPSLGLDDVGRLCRATNQLSWGSRPGRS